MGLEPRRDRRHRRRRGDRGRLPGRDRRAARRHGRAAGRRGGRPAVREHRRPAPSRARAVAVMHACGHDTHTAMLLAAAEALVGGARPSCRARSCCSSSPPRRACRSRSGPAGAELMVAGRRARRPEGRRRLRPARLRRHRERRRSADRHGPILAAADRFEIVVEGRQAHGSKPWAGIDPIVVGSEIVGALQTHRLARSPTSPRSRRSSPSASSRPACATTSSPTGRASSARSAPSTNAMRADIHARVKRIAEQCRRGARRDARRSRSSPAIR